MVFVTGGTGILGSYLLLELSKRHAQILALRQSSSQIEKVRLLFEKQQLNDLYSHIEWIEGSLHDMEFLDEITKKVHTIYHCAAVVSFDERDRQKMFQTNIEGTKNLVNVAIYNKISCFCHVSSIAVLDTETDAGITDETSEWNKELPHSSYAQSKYLSEMEVWRASQEGLNVVIVNPAVILGATDFSQSSGTIFELHHQKNYYTTSGYCEFVDAKDVAFCMTELVEKHIFNERFILISERKSYREVASILRKLYNKKEAKLISDSLLKFGVFLSPLLRFFIPKMNQLNKATYQALTSKNNISNQKIREKLSFSFRKVDESLLEYGNDFLAQHKS